MIDKAKEERMVALRRLLGAKGGEALLRRLEALFASGELEPLLRRDFPRLAAILEGHINRRDFLKLTGATLGLAGLTACAPPHKQLVPYVEQPPLITEGEPLFFATALPIAGYAMGVLVESHMGRPTKVEGNPAHPASLGATGMFAQSEILQMWDPFRSQSVTRSGYPDSWENFQGTLMDRMDRVAPTGGEGLRLLTGTLTSPTVAAQIDEIRKRFPKARWHRHEPLNSENAMKGAWLAFEQKLVPLYHFDKAAVIVSLDADFLGEPATQVRQAHDFVQRRRVAAPEGPGLNRLYVAECTPTLTGGMADHRLSVRSGDIAGLALHLARRLDVRNVEGEPPPLHPDGEKWLAAVLDDLRRYQGEGLVVAGDRQPPEVHALVHRINALLHNREVITFVPPVDAASEADSLEALVRDMREERVNTLFILDSNPVYSAPVDLEFGPAIAKVPFTVHLGLYVDETAVACTWHIPMTHPLESWGDSRAFDGTATIQQPLIAPVFGGHAPVELLATALRRPGQDDHQAVHDFWSTRYGSKDPEGLWQTSLRQGFVSDSAPKPVEPGLRQNALSIPVTNTESVEINFAPDPTVLDGRYSNNSWLQEIPKPLTQLTWDNVVLMGPATARQLGVGKGDVVAVDYDGRTLEGPVWIMAGHAEGAVTLTLGYGRRRAGLIGAQNGYDAYALRTLAKPWFDSGAKVGRTGRHYPLASAQGWYEQEHRNLAKWAKLDDYRRDPHFATKDQHGPESLYPDFKYTGYAWGMTVNINTCIGCSACVVACQAENNIPVVGKDQIRVGRAMHWLRIDTYFPEEDLAPPALFQPVPCMQCELAPCEPVCPVEASVHDSEGINVQVYNRCVGTRFCSNNCPYKVRRFNFLAYSDNTPSLQAQKNPEVTVRMRGVMEKCNYCLQRIARGRIQAELEDRRLRDGEVLTACQAVCPTNAIVFGDLNDKNSQVVAMKASPLNYVLLDEENTRPRTTYLAKVLNPHALLESKPEA